MINFVALIDASIEQMQRDDAESNACMQMWMRGFYCNRVRRRHKFDAAAGVQCCHCVFLFLICP